MMAAPLCERNWEVEATRDGRLRGKDLESALRHRAQCGACADEARALAALGEHLAELPSPAVDALKLRRARLALLGDVNAVLLARPAPKRRGARWALASGGLVAAALAVFVGRATLLHAGRLRVDVRAGAGARWQEHREVDSDLIELREGGASFSVRRRPGQRVVIQLPDGELEDTGTVFDVQVAGGRTRSVRVHQGSVVLRLRGRPSVSLAAGQAWHAEGEPVAAADGATSLSASDDEWPKPAMTASASLAAAAPSAPSSVSPPPGARPKPPTTSNRSAGPSDASRPMGDANTAEDDAYLRVVELVQQGKSAEARWQAKQYLRRFPQGFRRPEVSVIATSSPASGK